MIAGVGYRACLGGWSSSLISKYSGLLSIANADWSNLKFASQRLDDLLQNIYFIFARFCKFQKLFEERTGERIAKRGEQRRRR
jgi:hypothetical protein